MPQLTLRIDTTLVEHLKATAAERGESVNGFATSVLRAAVDPDFAGTEATQLRERLARAGLLAVPAPVAGRPSDAELQRARKAAGSGRQLSELVSEDRR